MSKSCKVLKPEVRAAIIRLRSAGQSYGGVAKAVGVPFGTVASVCARAGLQTPNRRSDPSYSTPPPVPAAGPVDWVAKMDEAARRFPIPGLTGQCASPAHRTDAALGPGLST